VEYSTLISSSSFARHNTSTWRLLTPAMDLFVRRARLQHQREFVPLGTAVAPGRKALVNQFSFIYFSLSPHSSLWGRWDEAKHEAAFEKAKHDISEIEKSPVQSIPDLSDKELDDAREQIWRLRLFFHKISADESYQFFPEFSGCGIIDTGVGDLLISEHLFEIKAGERRFLSVDLRQLLTYAALNYASSAPRQIRYLGLFNPRVGISFSIPLEVLSQEVSGTSANDLLAEITRVISSGDTSR
jgi:hypothetical protein